MSQPITPDSSRPALSGALKDWHWRLSGLGLLIGAELLILAGLYRHAFDFECRAVAPVFLCAALGFGLVRVIALLGVVAVFGLARPALLANLAQHLRARLSLGWLAAAIGGFLVILLPYTFLSDGAGGLRVALAFACWLGGAALAGGGILLAAIPAKGWGEALRSLGPVALIAAVLALLAPEIAALVQKLWYWDVITLITFRAVEGLLIALGQEVTANPQWVELGVGDFIVLVGPQCSGVEGFALITAFLTLYMWLFRDVLAFPRVLLLFPVGILFSWLFNVIRIAVLIVIGDRISPDLAIGAFHSHAGWLMFTLLAVSLSYMVHRLTWFRTAPQVPRAAPAATLLPFREDPAAAQILPFIVFMASALLSQTFAEVPGLFYPLRALAVGAALWLFRDWLRAQDWRPDLLALGLGVAIGVLWLVTAPAGDIEDSALAVELAGLPAGLLVLWIVSRLVGTVILVPLVEELFFRGYVLGRLDRGDLVWRVAALLISAALFAALHDRWLIAGAAGLVFGLVMLRRGRLTDAVWAHAGANAVIGVAALIAGDWSLI